MGRPFVEFTFFTSILLGQTSQASRIPPHLSMTVLLHDHARVAEGQLSQAEQAIIRIFAEAGIEMILLDCTSPSAPDHTAPECLRPLGPTDLVVRIEPGVRPGSKRALGFSQGTTYASIYYRRAAEIAGEQLAQEGDILGCGIAHEIGHLLLRSQSHSPRGIMRAEWGKEELKLISTRSLHFTPQQAEVMRAELTRRTSLLPQSAFR